MCIQDDVNVWGWRSVKPVPLKCALNVMFALALISLRVIKNKLFTHLHVSLDKSSQFDIIRSTVMLLFT